MPLPRRPLSGTTLEPSVIGLGTVLFGVEPSRDVSFALLDAYVEAEGNFIDTAHCYSDWVPGELGRSEKIIGQWMRSRGVRDKLVLATKGGHPSFDDETKICLSAEKLNSDLAESLDRLQTDRIDLYWLHRDEPERPVEEIVDTLNSFVSDGRVRFFGGSNWTAQRLLSANDYAKRTGQAGFVASQPWWSLGVRAMRPHGRHGLQVMDSETFRFHRETQLPVIAYTAQASGYFSKHLGEAPDDPAKIAEHPYHTEPNRRLAKELHALSKQSGVSVTALVLAFLMHQPFPVYPLIGPRTLEQLRASLPTTATKLSLEIITQLLALESF